MDQLTDRTTMPLKGVWRTHFSVRALGVRAILAGAALFSLATIASADFYEQTNLVSDLPGLAKVTDPNLVNPWGIAHPSTGPWWVNDNGAGVSTVYNGEGEPFPVATPLVVTVPPPGGSGSAAPTGIIFNGTKDFEVSPGKPARFIFVTEDGTVSAWNSGLDAILEVNNSPQAVYKGAAMALNGGVLFLYVANFRGGTVDVFGTDFKPVALAPGAFTDAGVPNGFAPFNVMNVSGRLVVTYAEQDADKHDDVAGPGKGFVDVFDPNGTLLSRLGHGPWMNSPWGVALAPNGFGRFSNHLLVGNFGSGQIAAFDPENGRFRGLLKGPPAAEPPSGKGKSTERHRKMEGLPITIDGLWGLGFGNGATAGPVSTLFFTAGIEKESHGLFGTLTPVADNDQD